MGHNLHELRISAPAGLRERILARIEVLRRRYALMRAAGLGTVAFLSTLGFVQAVFYTNEELYLSGFDEYVRLLWSDGGASMGAWREVGLSMLESLPALPLIALCLCLIALLWSVARTLTNIRSIRTHAAV